MSSYVRFEDLPVWKNARKLTRLIYQISSIDDFSKDFGLRDQIRKAAISVMSNIAEGFEHESQAQFITYLGRAKASVGEIRCQLYIAKDLNYISKKEMIRLVKISEDCSKQLFGFIKYLRSLPNSPRISFSGEAKNNVNK
jgi:four helix bundle protein